MHLLVHINTKIRPKLSTICHTSSHWYYRHFYIEQIQSCSHAMDTGSVLIHCICKMGICWRDIRQAKKTCSRQCRDGNFQHHKKTTPSLSPLIRPKPRSSKQTHAGGASDWLEGRCACGCDVGLPTLWIEKRGSRRTERLLGRSCLKQLDAGGLLDFGGRSWDFTQSVWLWALPSAIHQLMNMN